MKNRYRVELHGRNFLLRFPDPGQQKKKHGFYTTRDVQAESFEDAEMKAVELVRSEDRITSITINPKDDSPMLYVENIRLLGDEEETINNSGYTYYPEDDDSRQS